MTRFLPRIRFLPATILAACLMLSLKVGSIWVGFEDILKGPLGVTDAQAQQPDAAQ